MMFRIVKLNKTEDDVLEDSEISAEELKQLADQVRTCILKRKDLSLSC